MTSLIKPSKKFWIILIFTLSVVYLTIFSKLADFSNNAYFGGDTWEYQSMGVNFAYGYGIQKFGGLVDFEKYKFENKDENIIKQFEERAGENDFYRTPIYPLFLGITYKVFGISPLIVKNIQLILLVLVASFLPYLGYRFWKKPGLFAGIIASPVFISTNYEFSKYILTESLIVFFIFLIVISFINYQKKPDKLNAIILGIILGLSLLLKGSLIFIPVIIFIYLSFLFWKNRDKKILKNILFILLPMIITILPWSIYASYISKSFIILSNQSNRLLLTFNNEFSTDGGWHPEYEKISSSFYNNDGLSEDQAFIRVINFYLSNPSLFVKIFTNKIMNSLYPFAFLWVFLITNILIRIKFKLSSWTNTKIIHNILLFLSVLILSFTTILGISDELSNESQGILYNKPLFFLLLLFGTIAFVLNTRHFPKLKIPLVFLIVISNFFLTILITGNDNSIYKSRYIKVADFAFILTSIYFLLFFLKQSNNNFFLNQFMFTNSTLYAKKIKKY